jgi:two-component system, LytTR family, sensor kinase
MSFPERIGYRDWAQIRKAYAIIFSITIVTYIIRYLVLTQFGMTFHFNLYLVSVIGVSFIWESLRLFNHYLNRVFPYERSLVGRISIQIFFGALMGFIMRIIIYFAWEPYIPFKLDNLFIAVTWFMFIILPAGINLAFFTAHFFRQWKKSIIRAERLEKEKVRVQFDNLKNQLNPHFLFNALTSLNSLIREDPELASRFLQHMSKIYRYVLQHKDQRMVSVQTELDFINNYVFLAETRFANALTIQFHISEIHLERTIMPVTLQLLLENAFKHNIMDAEKPLHIEVYSEGEYISIRNNLQRRKSVEGSNKLGLENLKSLYQFITDKPVIVEETTDTFTVKIPLV